MQDLSPDELKQFIPLTSKNPLDIQLPGAAAVEDHGGEHVSELLTHGIEEALEAEKIRNVLIEETTELKLPAYMVDFTNIEVSEAALKAIYGMLPGGNTSMYIKINDSLIFVGSGDDYMLYTVLEDALRSMFSNKCKLYKNNGDGFKTIGRNDLTSVRLNL